MEKQYTCEGFAKSHYSQRDNSWNPGSTCFLTSVAIAIATEMRQWDLTPPKDLDEILIKDIQSNMSLFDKAKLKYGSFTTKFRPDQIYKWWEWYFVKNVFADYKAEYMALTLDEIKMKIYSEGIPLVVGTFFPGGGHMVCVGGFNPTGFFVNDPWGDANTKYAKNGPDAGKMVNYAFDDPRWFPKNKSGQPAIGPLNCIQIWNEKLYNAENAGDD